MWPTRAASVRLRRARRPSGRRRRRGTGIARGRPAHPARRASSTLEARELLRAPARLLRALPRAEPVDVLLRARDLLLLPRGRAREQRVPVRALPGVLRVAALVLDDLRALRGRLERQRARGDPVE